MKPANRPFVPPIVKVRQIITLCVFALTGSHSFAAGTAVGTVIDNTASIDYDLAGVALTLQSNTTTLVVAERINVVTTLLSPQTLVAANDTNRALLFTVTNTGNGSEVFLLSINSILPADDFDPVPAVPAIYFDTDSSGDFSAADQAYLAGTNDPVLLADESVSILILNDIPAPVVNGEIGRSRLIADAATGTGAPGTVFANQGDGGVDAVVGSSGASDSDDGEYLVSDVLVSLIKAQVVLDPFGGAEPIPGATLTYTITAEVASTGIATASVVRDSIPLFSSFVANSLTLNGVVLTDAVDADAGELDSSGAPAVVVRLGDLIQADGIQTIVFQVTID